MGLLQGREDERRERDAVAPMKWLRSIFVSKRDHSITWRPTGIKWDTHKHDEAMGQASAERARVYDISKRKLAASRALPKEKP